MKSQVEHGNWIKKGAFLALGLMVCLGLLLCGGCAPDAGDDDVAVDTGELAVSFRDAPTDDILAFDCQVLSVNLTRSDGMEVGLLPTARRVDFADLVEVSELFTLGRVPVGYYTEVRVTLNLVNNPPDPDGVVACLVDNAAPATVLDTNGRVFTDPVELVVHLDPQTPLVVVPGSPRVLDIDFDLDASTVVNVVRNEIKVLPILKAEVSPNNREIRVRGGLLSTDADAQSFMLGIRPHANSAPFGAIEVVTTATTFFEVDGVAETGAAGFALLQAMPATTAIIARGTFDYMNGVLTATSVRAGSSVPGGTLDIVRGIVTACAGTGNDLALTVVGFTLERETATVAYQQTVTVITGDATRVIRRFRRGLLQPDAIGVGQEVICSGDLSGLVMGSVAAPTEVIHLVPTRFLGEADGPLTDGTLSVQLVRIGRFPFPAAFTGVPANPWIFDTATISMPTVTTGTPVQIRGIVTPGAATEADALSIVDMTDFSRFVARWKNAPTQNPISTTPTEMTVDLSQAPPRTAYTATALGTPQRVTGVMTVRKRAATTGLFTIRDYGGPTTTYTVFADWSADLDARLAAGARPLNISAVGELKASDRIEADRVHITVQ